MDNLFFSCVPANAANLCSSQLPNFSVPKFIYAWCSDIMGIYSCNLLILSWPLKFEHARFYFLMVSSNPYAQVYGKSMSMHALIYGHHYCLFPSSSSAQTDVATNYFLLSYFDFLTALLEYLDFTLATARPSINFKYPSITYRCTTDAFSLTAEWYCASKYTNSASMWIILSVIKLGEIT